MEIHTTCLVVLRYTMRWENYILYNFTAPKIC